MSDPYIDEDEMYFGRRNIEPAEIDQTNDEEVEVSDKETEESSELKDLGDNEYAPEDYYVEEGVPFTPGFTG